MNKLNFLILIIIGIALICGCKFSSNFGSDTSNSNRTTRNNRGSDSPRQTKNQRSGGNKDDIPENESADDDNSTENSTSRRQTSDDSGDISKLAGKWVWSRTGSSVYSGGVYSGGNGSRFTYDFSDDGQVEFTGIMNVMQGTCQMQIFTSKTGQASLDGNTLTIDWSPTHFSRDDSCDSANNYEKNLPAETETQQVAFKNSSGQQQLCLTGKDETCFSPAE